MVNLKDLQSSTIVRTDFLIIGSGLAGLYSALYASNFGSVSLLTKSTLVESNSYWAQGGIAAALDSDDSPYHHLEDTIEAGRGLSNKKAVEILVGEGKKRVEELIEMGMEFDRGTTGFDLGLEGGHRKRRVLHAGGNATGREILNFIIKRVKEIGNIKLYENTDALQLISNGNMCAGVIAIKDNAEIIEFFSKATVLATGGACALYQKTTNPKGSVGDGISLAYESGADLMDMEFAQFHPTVFHGKHGYTFLISEALRGEGAILYNSNGYRFMRGYHELEELAPRDIVTKAILNEINKTGEDYVFLSLEGLSETIIKTRFSNIYNACLKHGIDITKEAIPVSPAAHYTIGGVKTGLMGETNIGSLYAVGEVSCTGVHGANRLASNSLLECIVFAKRAIDGACAESTSDIGPFKYDGYEIISKHLGDDTEGIMNEKIKDISSSINKDLGIVRNEKGLESVLNFLNNMKSGLNNSKLINILDICIIMAKAALLRKETRGSHIREDYPNKNERYKIHFVWNKNAGLREMST